MRTFLGVKAILGIFYSEGDAFPATSVVGTATFAVQIEGGCSGIEGVMLMLTLTVAWLIFMRSELRLIRAIWLVPVAVAAVWLLNLVRIAVLISIGDAGHSNLAIHGFHTEAGWIFFNVIAIGFLLTAEHVTWLRKGVAARPGLSQPNVSRPSAEVIYLSPFLAIIAASLVSQLLSNGFEWLYPLRFIGSFACVLVLPRRVPTIRLAIRMDRTAGRCSGLCPLALAVEADRGRRRSEYPGRATGKIAGLAARDWLACAARPWW